MEAEAGGSTVEEKIRYPFQCSSQLFVLLFAVCREIHRVGVHTLDKVKECDWLAFLASSYSDFFAATLGDHSVSRIRAFHQGIGLLYRVRRRTPRKKQGGRIAAAVRYPIFVRRL